MCLIITVRAPAAERDALTAATAGAVSPVQVALAPERGHAPRWPWARPRDTEATVSEDGSCACSLLADDADWDAAAWALRPDVREPLALTLEALTTAASRAVVEALWAGDQPASEQSITPAGLAALVRAGELGTRVRYLVSAAPAL